MTQFDETLQQPPRPRFDSTQWSLVMQSQHLSTPEGRVALGELCQRYWYPLFAYVRCLGHDLHQAQDLTQGFFEQLIEKNYVGDADPARGKFRTFLLTSLRNYMANEHDRRTAQKRGGERKHFSLQFQDAEQRFGIEPTMGDSPEARFQQQWARSLLDCVIQQLQETYVQQGKESLFLGLKHCLVSDEASGKKMSRAELADQLGISDSALRVAIHRMRSQYRKMLRSEIAATVEDPGDVDEEIAALFSAFSRNSSC